MKNTTLVIDGKRIPALQEEFTSCCVLTVTAGTNGPRGGDSGHGCRTVLKLDNSASVDLRIRCDNGDLVDVDTLEIILGGDCELDVFIDGLRFAAEIYELIRSIPSRE